MALRWGGDKLIRERKKKEGKICQGQVAQHYSDKFWNLKEILTHG